jgi:hypothetical protein
LALLMRSPEDNRCRAVCMLDWDMFRARWEFSDMMLVLMI